MNRLSANERALFWAGLLLLAGLLFPLLVRPLPPPEPSDYILGERALQEGRFYQAEQHFRRALDDPETKARALGRLGLLALLRGNQGEAIWRLQAAIRADPNDTAAQAYLGLLYLQRGDETAAMETWEQARAQAGARAQRAAGPTFLVLALRGEAHYRWGEMAAAAADMAALLEEAPPSAWEQWAHLRLAVLTALDRPDEARDHLWIAQQRLPGGEWPWTPAPELIYQLPAGERRRRARELDRLLASLGDLSRGERALAIGQLLLAQDDASGAVHLLEAAALLRPQDTRLRAYLGYARVLLGQGSAGLRLLHSALVWAPHDPLNHHLLARAYLEQGRTGAARNELEQALGLSPDDPVILLDLAQVEQQAGDYAQAAHWFSQTLIEATGVEETCLYALIRARFYLESSWSLCEQGPAAARTAVRLNPDVAEAWRIEGAILAHCYRPREAIPLLRQALELDPASAAAYDALGIAYLALEEQDAARQAFIEAANREPGTIWSRHARNWLAAHPASP